MSYYVFFVKKPRRFAKECPLSNLLKKMKDKNIFVEKDYYFSRPGYVSKTCNTIDKFFKSFPFNGFKNFYFISSMNGKSPSPKCKHLKLIDCYNSNTCGVKFPYVEDEEHSKIIYFCDEKKKPYGLLVGSSNQSYKTYYSNKQNGEGDVLIIDENILISRFETNTNSNIDEQLASLLNEAEINPYVIVSKQIGGKFEINLPEELRNFKCENISQNSKVCVRLKKCNNKNSGNKNALV